MSIHLYTLALLLVAVSASFHLPESNKKFIVAIDIGHSVEKQGAMSSRGIGEYHFNKSVALALLKRLSTKKYFFAFIINPDDKNVPLKKRAEIAERSNADILISIHHDSVQPRYLSEWIYQGKKQRYTEKQHGYSLFMSNKNSHKVSSLLLAKSIGESLLQNKFLPSLHHAENIEGEKNQKPIDTKKGIYEYSDLLILKTPNMPTLLIECGVIVNRDEEILLGDLTYQEEFVSALEKGISAFASQK